MKRKFADWTCVSFFAEASEEKQYGTVCGYDYRIKKYEVSPENSYEKIYLPEESLEAEPPKRFSSEEVGRFFLYETNVKEMFSDVHPPYNFIFEEYCYTLDDVQKVINVFMENTPDENEYDERSFIITDVYSYCFVTEEEPEYAGESDDIFASYVPLNDSAMAEMVIYDIYESLDSTNIDFRRIAEDIENYRQGKPVRDRLWNRYSKTDLIKTLAERKFVNLTEEQKITVRDIITELSEKNVPEIIETLGYSYYGGNELYPCDWEKSRDCFLKLFSMENVNDNKKCQYANTLGYIYYYGRCNNGVPEYEKAFRYFSVAAAALYHEAMYKLSDMYIHGYGVEKNTAAAANLINLVFDDTCTRIMKGDFSSNFADAALRKGNLSRDGIENYYAYYYYTLADYAIRKRAKYNFYGDGKVFSGIQKELSRIRGENPLKNKRVITSCNPPQIVNDLFHKHFCKVKISRDGGYVSIAVERLVFGNKEKPKKVFECYPEYGYCELIDKKTFMAQAVKNIENVEETEFIADEIDYDFVNEKECILKFNFQKEEVFSITAECFKNKLGQRPKKALEKHTFASVEFSFGGRQYDYICDIPDVSVGDSVIVFANNEEKEVTVVRLFEMSIDDMPLDDERYKSVLRKSE